MATIFIFYLIITIDKNLYVIYNILYNQGVFIMENENENNKVYIKPFIILFLISIVIFAIMYFLHSKNIENRFNRTLQNYEKSINLIFENAITNKGSNENIYSAKEDLKLSFEIGFKMIESSMNEIMKNSNDILQFWFAFLSVIMIVFTIIGFFLNNNILNQAREQLKMIKREAKEETNKLIEENDKSIRLTSLFNLSIQAYNIKEYNLSINYLTEIIKIYEDDFNNKKLDSYDKAKKNCAIAYSSRGNANDELKLYKEALQDFNKSIKLNPNISEAYNNRGIIKSKLNKYEEAIDDYNEAIKLNPNFSEAYYNRGVSKYNLTKNKRSHTEEYIKLMNEAIKNYNKAIELNNNYCEAYYNRGISKLALNEGWGTIKDFIKAYELSNNNNEIKESSKNQLISLAKQGYEEAIEFCEENDIDYKN